MKIKTFIICAVAAAIIIGASSCEAARTTLKDGYYTAIMEDYDSYGWKEFLIIYVRDGQIVSAEFNAKNESGFVKSWDMDYMRTMDPVSGTYPNEYSRLFANDLMMTQTYDRIDAVTGATTSYENFKLLAEEAVERAYNGDFTVAYVKNPH